jgi:DNA-binding Xre family transcriptional regulator
MDNISNIIEKIEQHRLLLGYSKRKLASMADISEEYYWRIVTGKAPGVAFSVIESLCKAVYINICYNIDYKLLELLELKK